MRKLFMDNLIRRLNKLKDDSYTGTVTLAFHKGCVSKKIKLEVTENTHTDRKINLEQNQKEIASSWIFDCAYTLDEYLGTNPEREAPKLKITRSRDQRNTRCPDPSVFFNAWIRAFFFTAPQSFLIIQTVRYRAYTQNRDLFCPPFGLFPPFQAFFNCWLGVTVWIIKYALLPSSFESTLKTWTKLKF